MKDSGFSLFTQVFLLCRKYQVFILLLDDNFDKLESHTGQALFQNKNNINQTLTPLHQA